jgi:hypothetical protein
MNKLYNIKNGELSQAITTLNNTQSNIFIKIDLYNH